MNLKIFNKLYGDVRMAKKNATKSPFSYVEHQRKVSMTERAPRSTQAGGTASGRAEFSKAKAGIRSRETNLVQAVGQEIPEEKGEPSSRIQASHTACVKFEKEGNIKEQAEHFKELERR